MNSLIENHTRLIQSLRHGAVWPEGKGPDQVIETHISTVLLVGDYAYKIKKPLDLGFLDFSTLTRRHHFCQEEVRLNGRLAPDIYLDVIPITGSVESPRPFGEGEAINYAVRMRRFDQAGLLAAHPELLSRDQIDCLADQLVSFHESIAVAGAETPFGDPAVVAQPMWENFSQLRGLLDDPTLLDSLKVVEQWTEAQAVRLSPILKQRKAAGFIRECHGDLHLGNIALEGDRLLIFDGIEFNPDLRWIDVISELAFLLMDLDEKGLRALAQRLLNRYLELSGDYAALPLLRFYQVYRAMVRAKVTAIRLNQQLEPAAQPPLKRALTQYLDLAMSYMAPQATGLIITQGLSGSGKSTHTQVCLETLPAIRIRSDVERRRLAGLAPSQPSDSDIDAGIYQAAFTQKTYQHLLALARLIIDAGWVAIVDATFLRKRDRACFRQLAEAKHLPFLILEFKLSEEELRARIIRRQEQGLDPSEATVEVLEKQIQTVQPVSGEEQQDALLIVSDHLPMEQIAARIEGVSLSRET
ncbi:MAG: AAA family ATPase [Sedimenticola sp.]|nr:AAA family ATPase [Sedimenticola sp.]